MQMPLPIVPMSVGKNSLSLPSLITWPYFRDAVFAKQSKSLPRKNSVSRKWTHARASATVSVSGRQLSIKNSASRMAKVHTSSADTHKSSRAVGPSFRSASGISEMSDEDGTAEPVHESVLNKLMELYQVISDTFFVLDSEQTGHIDMANGAAGIQKALSSAGLGQLWAVLVNLADVNAELTHDAFTKAFLRWAGVDESALTGLSPDKALGRGVCSSAVCTPYS